MQIADLVLELRAELEQLLAGFDTFQDVVKRMGGAVYDLQARFDETTGGYKYFTDAANEATNAVRAQEQSVKSLSDRIGEYVQSQQLQIRALGLVNAASALSLRTAESNRVSMQGLRAAVDSTGASWEIAEGALTGYLDNLERTTAFQRKEGMESLRVLIAATGNYERALKLMPAVLGLAARSSMGLVSAARGVAQAAQGNVFMLGMWIPSLRNATTLQTQFKTKAELATFALKEAAKVKPPPPTPWQQLTQTIEELRRTVGEGLLPVWDTMNSSLVEVGRLGRWAADTGVGRLLLQLGFLALSFLSLRVAVAGILRLLIVFANQMGITAAATALYSAVTGGAALAGAGLTASLGAILAVILLVVAAYEALVQGIAWATYGMERLTGVNKKQAEADRDYILQTASLTERALRAKSKIAGATAEAQSAEEGLTEAANAQSDSMAELIQKHSRLTKMQETVASLTNYRTELTKSEAAAVQELADAHEQYSFAVDVAKMSKGILASQAQLEITNTLKDAELRLAAAEEKLATTRALLAESGLELAKQNDDYLKQAFERQRFNETGIVQASELEQAAADLFTSEQNLYRARKLTGETTKSGIRVAALQAGWDAKTVQGREKMAEIEQRDMYLQGMHTSLVDEYTQVVQDASKKLTHYTDVWSY